MPINLRTLLIALVIALSTMPAHAARQALVIGNGNYTNAQQVAYDHPLHDLKHGRKQLGLRGHQ